MQMKQLEHVQIIAEEKSITRAAQRLFISQQALSESLKLLERELGFPIFDRSNKGIVPTAAGEIFLNDLQTILPVIHNWKHLALKNQNRKTVKIFVQYVLGNLLSNADFKEKIENSCTARIDWETVNARDLLSRIQEEPNGIGLLHLIPGSIVFSGLTKLEQSPKFIVTPLNTSKMVCVLSQKNSLADQKTIRLQDLRGQQVIENAAFGSTSHVQDIITYTGRDAVFLPETVSIMDYLLQHKDTISYLPEIAVKQNVHIKNNQIVWRHLESDPDYRIFLVCSKKIYAEEKALLDEIKKSLLQ